MEWKDIKEADPYEKAVFGYWDQFERFIFYTFDNPDLPLKCGYTHVLKIIAPEK